MAITAVPPNATQQTLLRKIHIIKAAATGSFKINGVDVVFEVPSDVPCVLISIMALQAGGSTPAYTIDWADDPTFTQVLVGWQYRFAGSPNSHGTGAGPTTITAVLGESWYFPTAAKYLRVRSTTHNAGGDDILSVQPSASQGIVAVTNANPDFSAAWPTTPKNLYPQGGSSSAPTILSATGRSAGAAGAASAVATMANAASQWTWLTGFVARLVGNGATQVAGTLTITGLTGGTLVFDMLCPANGADEIAIDYNLPLPSSAVNTSVVATLAWSGGGTNSQGMVHVKGYRGVAAS